MKKTKIKNAKKNKIVFSIFLIILIPFLTFYACIRTPIVNENKFNTLFFYNDGYNIEYSKESSEEIKILQVSDLHFSPLLTPWNNKTLNALDTVLTDEEIDLVVVNGDAVWSFFNVYMLKKIANFFEQRETFWCYNFGNHDYTIGVSKSRLINILDDYDYCLFRQGYSNVVGDSNYFINLKLSGSLVATITMLDNGNKRIDQSQVDWYEWTIEGINAVYDRVVPNYIFMHIPMTQVAELQQSGTYTGVYNESVSAIYSQANMFEKIKELNSTKAVFNSHDHANDFWGYVDGIFFKSSRGSSYSGYTKGGFARGYNLLTINSTGEFTTESIILV